MRWTKEKPKRPAWYWLRNLLVKTEDQIVQVMAIKGERDMTAHFGGHSYPLKDIAEGTALWSDRPLPKPMEEVVGKPHPVGQRAVLRERIKATPVGGYFDFDGPPQYARVASIQVGAVIRTENLGGCGFRVWIVSKAVAS